MLNQKILFTLSLFVLFSIQAFAQPDADIKTPHKDQQILDDLIVVGSACIGQDCVNGESFGFDTLRLKENNLRIKFQDTSSSASFPTNDWQLTANDSSNGGANKFSIDDIDHGRTPFTIEASAPSHSLYVENSGEIGLGTNNPVVELHVVDGDSPTLRLEQNGSSGFTAQTWDVAGNEANFFVRDATNGSKLPFKIVPGAENDRIVLEANDNVSFIGKGNSAKVVVTNSGNVGIGTASPNNKLQVDGQDIWLNGDNVYNVIDRSALNRRGVVSFVTGGNPADGVPASGLQWNAGSVDSDDAGIVGATGDEFFIGRFTAGNSASMVIESNGDVGIGAIIPSHQLELSQDDAVKPSGGSWDAPSDKRLKTILGNYTDGLDQVLKIRAINYRYNGKGGIQDTKRDFVGVVAQELQEIAPYMVEPYIAKSTNEEYLKVKPSAFVYMLINSVQQQNELITSQEERLSNLELENEELKKTVEGLAEAIRNLTIDQTDVELENANSSYLEQNIPNPFKGNTQIGYFITNDASSASIHFTNMSGKLIRKVAITNTGKGVINLTSQGLAAGTYSYALIVDGQVISTNKMVLIE